MGFSAAISLSQAQANFFRLDAPRKVMQGPSKIEYMLRVHYILSTSSGFYIKQHHLPEVAESFPGQWTLNPGNLLQGPA